MNFPSTGHVLVMRHSQERSILPPFSGRWQYPEFMKWMEENKVHRIFVPRQVFSRVAFAFPMLMRRECSLPAPLRETPPTGQRIIHKLVYRQVQRSDEGNLEPPSSLTPTKTIQAEVAITRVKPADSEVSEMESPGDLNAQRELDELLIDDQLDALIAAESKQSANTAISDEAGETSGLKKTVELEDDSLYSTNEDELSSFEETTEPYDTAAKPESADQADSHAQVSLEDSVVCTRNRDLELLLALPDRYVLSV